MAVVRLTLARLGRPRSVSLRVVLTGERGGQVVIEQGHEARLEVAARDLITDDPELVERGLHELSPYLRLGVLIGDRPHPAQQQRLMYGCLDRLVVGLVLLDRCPCPGKLALYTLLLTLQNIDGQRVREVRLGELLLLAFQLLDAQPLRRNALAAVGLALQHPVEDDAANLAGLLLVKSDPSLPVGDSGGLDVMQ